MKYIKFPTRFVTPRNLLIATLVYMIFPLYALPNALKALQAAAGKDTYVPLGMKPGFSADEAFQNLETLGSAGRNMYLYSEMYMDSFYALSYGIFFAFLIVFLFQQAGGRLAKMTVVAWFPIVGSIADWIENIGIVQILLKYPDRADAWANIASFAGKVKWFFSGVALLYILVGLGVWGWTIIRRKP